MKVAVLADIHGNLFALEAVLNDIKAHNVDQVIILGDLITDFPDFTNNVLDLAKQCTKHVIKGNREIYVANFNEKNKDFNQFKTIFQTYNNITKDNLDYISNLPEELSFKYNNNFSYRCVHGSPFSLYDTLRENEDELIIKSFEHIEENVLFCGHNHRQWQKIYNGKYLISPGSVGVSLIGNKYAQYCLADFNETNITIELKNINYDFDALKQKYSNEKNTWTVLCIKSIEDGINYGKRFLNEAKIKTNKWPIPNKEWDEVFDDWYKKGIL